MIIRAKYFAKCAALQMWDGFKIATSLLIQLVGIVVIIEGLLWAASARSVFPDDRDAAFWLCCQRMPLCFALNAWGWVVFILGKRMRDPSGWQSWTWRELLLSAIRPVATDELLGSQNLAARIHLEAMARQNTNLERLSDEEKTEIAQAARSAASAAAYRELILLRRQGKPVRPYLVSLSLVLVGMALSSAVAAATRENRDVVVVTESKQASLIASLAVGGSCLSPPTDISHNHHNNGNWDQLTDQPMCMSPPPFTGLELALLVSAAQRFWSNLDRLPDPPWRSIDHVPLYPSRHLVVSSTPLGL